MAILGLPTFRRHLSEYLRRVQRGEEILVTEQGIPIALLRPIGSLDQPASLEARLAKMAAEGRLSLPTRRRLKTVRPVKIAGPPISRTILEDRR